MGKKSTKKIKLKIHTRSVKTEKRHNMWDFIESKRSVTKSTGKFLSSQAFKCPIDLDKGKTIFRVKSNGNYLVSTIKKGETLIGKNTHMEIFNIGGKIKRKKKGKDNRRERKKKTKVKKKYV